MKKAYFIYVVKRGGNVGPHEIICISENPEKGFKTLERAETELCALMKEGSGFYFEEGARYKFVILPTYTKS